MRVERTAKMRLNDAVDLFGVDAVARMIVEKLSPEGIAKLQDILAAVDERKKTPLASSPKEHEGRPFGSPAGTPPHGTQEVGPMATAAEPIPGEVVPYTREMVQGSSSKEMVLRGDMPLINIPREKARMDNFREFVDAVLEEGVHYGIPKDDKGNPLRGVKRFLWQSGAEVLFRALECRAEYEVTHRDIDFKNKLVVYETKCRVYHIASGVLMGEKSGAATSLEGGKNCYVKQPRQRVDENDVMFDCPVHGINLGATFRKDNQNQIRCAEKTGEPMTSAIHNTQAKAEKRAYVGAIRAVGCVSEIFTQDEDQIPNRKQDQDWDGSEQAGPARQAAKAPAKAAAPKKRTWPAWRKKAGWFHSKEWRAECVAAISTLKAKLGDDWQVHTTIFLVDDDFKPGEKLGPSDFGGWAEKHEATALELAEAVIKRFGEPESDGTEPDKGGDEPPADEPAAPAGLDNSADPDDLPFD